MRAADYVMGLQRTVVCAGDDAGQHGSPYVPAHGAHARVRDEGGQGGDEHGRRRGAHRQMLHDVLRYAHLREENVLKRLDDEGPARAEHAGQKTDERTAADEYEDDLKEACHEGTGKILRETTGYPVTL